MIELAFNQYICPSDWRVIDFLDAAAALDARWVAITHTSLDEMPIDRLKAELMARGLSVTSLNSAGRFTWDDPAQVQAQSELNALLIDVAAELQALVLTVITGGTFGRPIGEARKRVAEGLHDLDLSAGASGVQLGLEPIHPIGLTDKGCVNSISQACKLIDELSSTGLLLDLFHSHWDPDLVRVAESAPVHLIQICNLMHPPGQAPNRLPSLAPGRLDVAEWIGLFRQQGYARPFEFEIFAADHGHSDPKPLMRAARDLSVNLGA